MRTEMKHRMTVRDETDVLGAVTLTGHSKTGDPI